jgi:hypothetical protein
MKFNIIPKRRIFDPPFFKSRLISHFLLSAIFLCSVMTTSGQQPDSVTSEKSLREKVLTDIQEGLNKKTKTIDSTVDRLDQKVDELDKSIKETNNVREKADKLIERVQALEDKQKALEQNELNVYQANYQSAVVNLLYMDREIKPLILFRSSREFFELLTDLTNPTSYEEFNSWYEGFHGYIQKAREKNASLDVLSEMLNVSVTATSLVPLGGPVTTLFISGMGDYIQSLGKKQHDLKEKSQKMFLLVTKLGQFAHDKGAIEQDWVLITKELEDLHNHYEKVLDLNLKALGISHDEFSQRFTQENDADKRYNYITDIRRKAAELVANQKTAIPKDWKENIYYSQMAVQSLKIRFGNITFRLEEYIDKYQELLQYYSKDPGMGEKIAVLVKKLNELKDIFDNAFNPLEYINSATRMYKVI